MLHQSFHTRLSTLCSFFLVSIKPPDRALGSGLDGGLQGRLETSCKWLPRSTLQLMVGSRRKFNSSHRNFLPVASVWLKSFALNLWTDERCFCPRLKGSLEMNGKLIIHKVKMDVRENAASIWHFMLRTYKALPLSIFNSNSSTHICSEKIGTTPCHTQ